MAKPGGSYDISALVENFTAEGLVILSEGQPSDYLYKRMMLVGENGPAKRPAAEASYILEQLKALREAGVQPETEESRAVGKKAKKKNKSN